MAGLDDIIESPLVVDADEPLAKAIGLMGENGAYGVIVVSEGKYLGVVDDRCLLKFEGNVEKTKCGSLIKKTNGLKEDSSAEEMVADFISSDATLLPVLRDERVVGSITRRNALKLLVDAKPIAGKRVENVMSAPAITLPDEATIAQAVSLMRGKRIFRVVIVDAKGKVEGVLSSYDLAMKLKKYSKQSFTNKSFSPSKEGDLSESPVTGLMTANVVTIAEGAPLKEAVRKMIDSNLRALVVSRDGKPVGTVSAQNVFEACLVGKPLNVFVHGLAPEEKMLKESIVEEGADFMERLGKFVRLSADDSLELHVKTNREGFKKRFEVKSLLTVGGKVFASRTPPNIDEHRNNWDAHLAVRESLDELHTIVTRGADKARTEKKAARGLRRDVLRGGETEE